MALPRPDLPATHVLNLYGQAPATSATGWSNTPDLGQSYDQYLANFNEWMGGLSAVDRIRAAHAGYGTPFSPVAYEEGLSRNAGTTIPMDQRVGTYQAGVGVMSPTMNPAYSARRQELGAQVDAGLMSSQSARDALRQQFTPQTGMQQSTGGTGIVQQPTGGLISQPMPSAPAGNTGIVQTPAPQPTAPSQPQTGLFSPNPNVPGGYEATMFQNFNMPHITNPPAPERQLQGGWLNAGDTMRIPSNLMSNVPGGMFGAINQQTQWNGYWPNSLNGILGPHGVSPGYGFYNSNSPTNYTGLFAQSNPYWGNPLASPAFPTPSPQTLSPYFGNQHWNSYRGNMSMNPDAWRDYINTYVGGQIDDAIQGGFADEIANAYDPLTGCLVNDEQCKANYALQQGG